MTPGGIVTMVGYAVAAMVFYLAARQRRLATEGIGIVALAGLCGGVLGARLTEWVLVHSHEWTAQPTAFFNPQAGGKTIIGGVLCGWIAVEIAKWRLGIRRSTGDMFALALPAGEAVGRIGCLLNGCCFGTTTAVPWAIYQHQAWRHPAQLYSAFVALVLFTLLCHLRSRLEREGDLFRLYLVLYGASRFAIEFLRDRQIAFGGLSAAQWVCLEVAVAGGLGLWMRHRSVRNLAPQVT